MMRSKVRNRFSFKTPSEIHIDDRLWGGRPGSEWTPLCENYCIEYPLVVSTKGKTGHYAFFITFWKEFKARPEEVI